MMGRYNVFSRPPSLRQMLDRLLEDAFVMPTDGGSAGGQQFGGRAAMDLYEEGDNLVLEVQLPGLKPEEIDVTIERGALTIRGQSKAEEERKERNYLIREQRAGSVMRSVQLPSSVNAEAAQATFEHGVLRLTFPKAEQHQPRRIQVRASSQHAIGAAFGSQKSAPAGGEQGSQQSGEAAAAGENG